MAAATYAERHKLLYHPTQNIEGTEFFGRVLIALMKAAIDVLNEAANTPLHKKRVAYAGQCLQDPRRMTHNVAAILAASLPVDATGGVVTVSRTDAQLLTDISGNWDRFAAALLDPYDPANP